jgi:hypothetical protein
MLQLSSMREDETERTMPMTRSRAALPLLTALWLAVAAPATALAQTADCTWYAETALKQQQRNEQGKCGFTGTEWNSSKQAHLTWCATQTPDRWKAEAQKREQMLAGCKR